MTTPYLGSYWFDAFEGAPQVAGTILEDITRPGVEGVAYRKIGYRGDIFRLRTMTAVAQVIDAYNLVVGYKSLVGTTQTLIDPLGNTWYNCLVLQCHPAPQQRFTGGVGGYSNLSSGYLVPCEWTLQLASIA